MRLDVRNLSVHYSKKTVALDGVSFSFENGILGLLGKNGAGKTTLIKTILKLLPNPFINDPFALVWTAFKNLDPDKECEAFYDQHHGDQHDEEYGFAHFPDDGSTPSAFIYAEHSINTQTETFAHELAYHDRVTMSFNSIMPMLLVMGLGYFLRARAFLTPELPTKLNRANFNVFLSIMCFQSAYAGDLSGINSGSASLFCVAGVLIEYFSSCYPAGRTDPKPNRHAILMQCFFRTNTMLIGPSLICAGTILL